MWWERLWESELRAEQEVVLANGRSYATLNVNLTGKRVGYL